jgi:hypothetical protein
LRKGGQKDELLENMAGRLVGGNGPKILAECGHESAANVPAEKANWHLQLSNCELGLRRNYWPKYILDSFLLSFIFLLEGLIASVLID